MSLCFSAKDVLNVAFLSLAKVQIIVAISFPSNSHNEFPAPKLWMCVQECMFVSLSNCPLSLRMVVKKTISWDGVSLVKWTSKDTLATPYTQCWSISSKVTLGVLSIISGVYCCRIGLPSVHILWEILMNIHRSGIRHPWNPSQKSSPKILTPQKKYRNLKLHPPWLHHKLSILGLAMTTCIARIMLNPAYLKMQAKRWKCN